MSNNSMNVVIAVNREYLKFSYIMLNSFFLNNPVSADIYVIHHDLTDQDETFFDSLKEQYSAAFHFLYASDDLLPPAEFLSANSWGIETYFRLLIMDLLPEHVDRALYIDSDMIINQSIQDFYFCDLNGKRLAACKDMISQPPFHDYRDQTFQNFISNGFRYFNAGFTLFNVKALRGEFSFQTYMDTAKSLNYQLQFPDQDLLNYCHYNDILFFDELKYNLYARRAYTDHGIRYEHVKKNTAVIHYASAKPWHGNCFHCDIEQLWWDYAKLTPFYSSLMEQTLRQVMCDDTTFCYVNELEAQRRQLYQIIEQYETILNKAGIH